MRDTIIYIAQQITLIMATFVEYSDQSKMKTWISGAKLTPIGYLTADPEQALRDLLPNFHVVNYLGVSIPSKSEYANCNQGLRLSPVADGIGLVGTIEMLNQSKLFRSCKHATFSDEQRRNIVDKMKSRISSILEHTEYLYHLEAKKYALIFDILGHPMSVDELVQLQPRADDIILNGGILMPEDLPKFP